MRASTTSVAVSHRQGKMTSLVTGINESYKLPMQERTHKQLLETYYAIDITIRVPFPKPNKRMNLYLTGTCTAGIVDTARLRSLNLKINQECTLNGWAKQMYGTNENGNTKRSMTSSMYVMTCDGGPNG